MLFALPPRRVPRFLPLLALVWMAGCHRGRGGAVHLNVHDEVGASSAALVRVVQAMPGPALDLSLVGDLTFRDLPFRTVTPYRQLRGNQATLLLSPHGATSPLAEVREMLVDGDHYTVVVQPAGNGRSPRLRVINDDPASWKAGRSWIRVLPALADSSVLDLDLNGERLLGGISRSSQPAYRAVPPGPAQFIVTPRGGSGAALRLPAATLVPDHLYTIILTGSPAGPDALEAITVEDRMTTADPPGLEVTRRRP